ncbi:bifunctional hydroxymethylpyrimidine kinase/phosphomethylpyrimidine kinase [Terriglobus albidus]|uniref:bifunctional hydroxymethylpyrimidine kinase/phosphomethylpyrimidine kinase n=1 Tax=Terriglobus albidus TaxID=1592106 RepID=UPI0021E03975|nr:bifunctional hydroxymethylpyrimidine kinase/phosphomethylpyrimidine kinase [Terriglobus albidus]
MGRTFPQIFFAFYRGESLLKSSRNLLTIAGFDPSSGAGITADLAVFAAHGFFGTSAITALTVQSTTGVTSVHPVEQAVLTDTLYVLDEDLPPSGVKIGMLGSEAVVEVVAEYLQRLACPVVLDTVLRSSSGNALLSPEAMGVFRSLLQQVDWVTPNVDELSLLTGMPATTQAEIEGAALALGQQYGVGVIATGGHLDTPDDYVLPPAYTAGDWLAGEHIATRATHGTGCAFSSAFLCGLVERKLPLVAAREAKEYVRQGMLRAAAIGHGKGPLNLLWPLTEKP